jgi:ATP-binding cassette subfamily C (CFTR/MRP) protein 1
LHDSKVYMTRPDGVKEGYVSYCAQTPWVVNATLRDNVLFGREYDEERYDEVVEACALMDDLVVLPAGDMTEIGERGINLSGGQKARVSLARALYSPKTKIMLYDDPLSAVDAHVGEHIFAHAINGRLAEGTTRILVTHHVHLLARCSSVIVLDHGRITHQGTYKDLVAQGVDFAGAVDISKAKVAEPSTTEPDKAEEKPVEAKKEVALTEVKKDELKQSGKKLVKAEEREEGAVNGGAYMHYGRAGGLTVAFFILVVQGLGRASEVMAGFWLAIWAERTLAASARGDPFSQKETNFYVSIYALLGVIGVLGLTARSILVAVHRLRASKKLHDELTHSVLRAPVAFFDVTPTGRILNRFAGKCVFVPILLSCLSRLCAMNYTTHTILLSLFFLTVVPYLFSRHGQD